MHISKFVKIQKFSYFQLMSINLQNQCYLKNANIHSRQRNSIASLSKTIKRFYTYVPTIFDKIINKEINSEIVFEDEYCLAFKDINPVAPVHILIIPKERKNLSGISQASQENIEILGRLLLTAKIIGDKLKICEGYRVVINEGGHGGQTVGHIHLHFLAGKQFGWPPGTDISNKKII